MLTDNEGEGEEAVGDGEPEGGEEGAHRQE